MKRILLVAIVGLVVINVLFLAGLGLVRKSATSQQKKELINLACPVPKQYCAASVPIYREGRDKVKRLYGLGWSLPIDTPVYSTFPGAVFPVRANLYPNYGQPALTLEQTHGKKNIRVTYVFSGADVIRYTVAQQTGEVLFTARNENIADTVVNLIVRIHEVNGVKSVLLEPEQVVFAPL